MRTLFLFIFVFVAAAATAQDAKRQLQEGLFEEQVNRDLEAAMKHYEALLQPYDKQRTWVATAVFRLGECYRKLGKTNEMILQYERVVKEFSDQEHLAESAVAHLRAAGRKSSSGSGPSKPINELDRVLAEMEAINQERIEIVALKTFHDNIGDESVRDEINRRFKDASISNLLTEVRKIFPDEQRRDLIARIEAGADDSLIVTTLGKTNVAKLDLLNKEIERRMEEVIAEREARSEFLEFKLETLQGSIALIQTKMLGGFNFGSTNAVFHAGATTNTVMQAGAELIEIAQIVEDSPDLLHAPYKGAGSPMEYAISKGFVSSIEFLLQAGVPASGRGSDGRAFLVEAAGRGNLAAAKILLASGPAEQDTLDQALESAARYGFLQMAEFLVQHGANADYQYEPSPSLGKYASGSPLRAAVDQGHFEMAKYLISQGADVNAVGKGGQTILAAVAGRRQGRDFPVAVQIAELLLKSGANPDLFGKNGRAPLHAASESSKMTELLLQHSADPNVRIKAKEANAPRYTPLHLAGNIEIARLLIDSGADVNAHDKFTPTPLLNKIYAYELERVKLLLDHGADPNIKGTVELLKLGFEVTPLAVVLGYYPQVSEERVKIMSALLEGGADPNFVFPHEKGRFSLLGRAAKQFKPLLPELLNAGAKPDLVPEENVFLYCVDQGQANPILWDVLPVMIKNGADVNRAREGFSPLMAAVSRKSTNVVGVLLAAGADPNQKNLKGSTPLDSVFGALRSDRLKDSDRLIYETMRRQLLAAGANYVSGRDDAITFLKNNGIKVPVLLRENQRHSSFNLLEVVALAFDGRSFNGFAFPDFKNVTLHRPTTNGYRGKSYDITQLLADTNAPPVPLQWGDVLEWKTLAHRVGAKWELPFEMREQFARRLARKVILKYVDEPKTRLLTPLRSRPFVEEIGTNAVVISDCWLSTTLRSVGDFLSTHDLSRVIVERSEEGAEPKRWLFDATGNSPLGRPYSDLDQSNMWLRDGDVVIVPHKSDKVDVPGYPFEVGIVPGLPGRRSLNRIPPPTAIRR